MEKTQNDLSYNKTKLDYQAMLKTAYVAYGRCLQQIERHLSELRDWPTRPTLLPHLSAKWLEDEAKTLTIVAETMYTLQEGLSREEPVVVNKPEVEDRK